MAAAVAGTPFSHCRDEWVQAFNEAPHTSFPMFRTVMETLDVGARDIFRDVELLRTFRPTLISDQNMNAMLHNYTWNNTPGRCTTFAIRVARRLQVRYPADGFNFQFFDLGRHRVARCDNYGFVIDSESRRGVEILHDDVNWSSTPNYERGRWRHYNNQSLFEDSTNPSDVHDVLPITEEEALGRCLKQVANNAVLYCLFRSMPDQESYSSIEQQAERARFHGSVRWRLESRRIELMPDLNNKHQFATITFGEGNSETNRICARKLVAFIRKCGIEEQWRTGRIDEFNRQLWQAAILEWGYPVYRE